MLVRYQIYAASLHSLWHERSQSLATNSIAKVGDYSGLHMCSMKISTSAALISPCSSHGTMLPVLTWAKHGPTASVACDQGGCCLDLPVVQVQIT